jgi:hypothetical protein
MTSLRSRFGIVILLTFFAACSSSGVAHDVHINQPGDPIEITVEPPSDAEVSSYGSLSRRVPVNVIVANNSESDVTVTHVSITHQSAGTGDTVHSAVNEIVDPGKEQKFPLILDLRLNHEVSPMQRKESVPVNLRVAVTLANGDSYFQDFQFRVDV